jgi:hypothetical protein
VVEDLTSRKHGEEKPRVEKIKDRNRFDDTELEMMEDSTLKKKKV